ncbi:MAG: hypothetical protein P4L69_01900, partial [Desulfosporosinus sp.]|nr:hypothetical protein [Desulfosporosinus sp.]
MNTAWMLIRDVVPTLLDRDLSADSVALAAALPCALAASCLSRTSFDAKMIDSIVDLIVVQKKRELLKYRAFDTAVNSFELSSILVYDKPYPLPDYSVIRSCCCKGLPVILSLFGTRPHTEIDTEFLEH